MAYTFTLNGKPIRPTDYNIHHDVTGDTTLSLELAGRVTAGAGDAVDIFDTSGLVFLRTVVHSVTVSTSETRITAFDPSPIATLTYPTSSFVYGDIVTWRNSHGAVPEHYMVVGPAASPGWVNLICLDADEPYINDLWGNNFVRVP